MVASYTILGKSIPSHFLALGTFGAVIGGTLFAKSGSSAPAPVPTKKEQPATTAKSSNNEEFDVEKLIDSFLKEEDKK
ncbi:ATP19 family protein SCDLUD_004894 [Saccharomycodes ludwigii]|uniref:ATP19 family protein n=1 Tax=Saccharomycodes ludwigii TaxID=36035 RepID=UPI001E85E35C|nr:hypothetical protein SCDLUD_004894 [Saccharomycodes ludwigii]KAH3899451.1 hypothetical protein SCDLUD_004894 [Saccharomycodes ludwigii]